FLMPRRRTQSKPRRGLRGLRCLPRRDPERRPFRKERHDVGREPVVGGEAVSAPAASRPSVVILDLFGTLVPAPSAVERSSAAAQFAETLRVPPAVVETALTETWLVRHNGQLNSTAGVAAHLFAHCGASASRPDELERLMTRLALTRLQADATLL